jgi:hypothetical protein
MHFWPMWVLPLIVLTLVATAALVVVAVRRVRAEGGVMTPGFKGWLTILAAVVWLMPPYHVAALFGMIDGFAPAVCESPWVLRVEILFLGLSILLSTTSLVLMIGRSMTFPIMVRVVTIWSLVSFPLSLLVARAMLKVVYGVSIGFAELLDGDNSRVGPWLFGLAVNIACLAYVSRSRRAVITFVN